MRPDTSQPIALVGSSAAIRTVKAALATLASSSVNVLLEGPAATGKRACAGTLQRDADGRAITPTIVPLDGVREADVEARLFGAIERASRQPVAKRPLVYLSAVESLSRRLQRRLDERLAREGEAVRLVSSSTVTLAEQVRLGLFCPTLYRRLAVVRVRVVPLVERREDIATIVESCLARRYATRTQPMPRLAPAAMAMLRAHDWPGNLRDVERFVDAMATSSSIVTAARVRALLNKMPTARHAPPRLPLLRDAARDWIASALASSHGNQSIAARRLGISRNTIRRRMRGVGGLQAATAA